MRTPEPLRNSPFSQFRKRKSLYSKLYGEGRSDPIGPIDNMPHYRGTHGQVSPKGYMSGSSEQYAPHPGFMQISQPDYQENDGLMMENISHLDHQRIIDEFRFAAMELAGNSTEHIPKYEDGLITEELFQELMESLREQLPPEFDTNEMASHLFAALSQDEEFGIEQDLQENMIEIQMAIEQARADPLAELNMEAEFAAQEAMFEQPIEETGPMMDSGPQTLENIVEAEQMQYESGMPDDMSGMPDMMDEGPVEQMDETPEHMEPYPEPLQDGYGMMQHEMYDEQMPDEMMDPFMGPEMMDPYMMPGPFEPMGFGPGGGP